MRRPEDRFSRRHGLTSTDAPITIRENAPESVRAKLFYAINELGLYWADVRNLVCEELGLLPQDEIEPLLRRAAWWEVYNIIEALALHVRMNTLAEQAQWLDDTLNDHFREAGIGWQLIDGKIETRGDEAFESTVRGAATKLTEAGLPTASQEIREALRDLSRRPEPDLTGALHHGLGALEAVAKQASGEPNLDLASFCRETPETPMWRVNGGGFGGA